MRGESLAANYDLFKQLLLITATAELPAKKTKNAFLQLLGKTPSLNTTCYNNNVYAGLRVDRLTIMGYHLRRLQRDQPAFQQCVNKTTGLAMEKVKMLLAMMDPCTAAEETQEDSQVAPTVCYPETIVDDGFPHRSHSNSQVISFKETSFEERSNS